MVEFWLFVFFWILLYMLVYSMVGPTPDPYKRDQSLKQPLSQSPRKQCVCIVMRGDTSCKVCIERRHIEANNRRLRLNLKKLEAEEIRKAQALETNPYRRGGK